MRSHEDRGNEGQDWTAFQLADCLLLHDLNAAHADWSGYIDPSKRAKTLARFHEYAYQWY